MVWYNFWGDPLTLLFAIWGNSQPNKTNDTVRNTNYLASRRMVPTFISSRNKKSTRDQNAGDYYIPISSL